MMTMQRQSAIDKSLGDTAVDGLMAGAVAGVASVLYLIAAGLVTGDSPATVLGRFDPQMEGAAVAGGMSHLAVSTIYGTLFAVLFRPVGRRWPGLEQRRWPIALLYGLILLLVARFLLAAGINSALAEIPLVHFGLFHIIYGLVLALALKRIGQGE